jgi:uncharacterized oligopeptide transporter (OPT) family protein
LISADRNYPRLGGVAMFLAATILAVIVGKQALNLVPLHVLFAVALSVIGASICARSAGLTDVSPLGPVGQLTQLLYGALSPAMPSVNIAAGSVVSGDATQTAVTLWSLRAGRSLRAPVASQIRGALLGCCLGALVCVPAYALFVHAYGLGSARLPVPTGVQWKTVGTILARGTAALPPGAAVAVLAAVLIAVLLATLGTVRHLLPSAFAVGIGMLVPFEYSLAIVSGAVFVALARRLRPDFWSNYGAVVGSGLIAGDSLTGIIAAILSSTGLLPP